MDWTTRALLAAGVLALIGAAVWLYLRRNPGAKPREDDLGSAPRDLEDDR